MLDIFKKVSLFHLRFSFRKYGIAVDCSPSMLMAYCFLSNIIFVVVSYGFATKLSLSTLPFLKHCEILKHFCGFKTTIFTPHCFPTLLTSDFHDLYYYYMHSTLYFIANEMRSGASSRIVLNTKIFILLRQSNDVFCIRQLNNS